MEKKRARRFLKSNLKKNLIRNLRIFFLKREEEPI
jgi:hypothetical protein